MRSISPIERRSRQKKLIAHDTTRRMQIRLLIPTKSRHLRPVKTSFLAWSPPKTPAWTATPRRTKFRNTPRAMLKIAPQSAWPKTMFVISLFFYPLLQTFDLCPLQKTSNKINKLTSVMLPGTPGQWTSAIELYSEGHQDAEGGSAPPDCSSSPDRTRPSSTRPS